MRRDVVVAAAVVLAHAGLFGWLGSIGTPPDLAFAPPPIAVDLIRPVPPVPPPPPPAPPAVESGGGSPTAPSRIHTPPKPRPVTPELTAPPFQAPEPAIVVGVAPIADPSPGVGQGGQGTGSGSGVGEGDGPGSGGIGPMIVRRATQGEILSVVPPAARSARRSGRAAVNCVIRLDQRLDDCRVVSQEPAGFDFGGAALRAAAFFRYRPPLDAAGRPVEGQRVTIFVLFGRQ